MYRAKIFFYCISKEFITVEGDNVEIALYKEIEAIKFINKFYCLYYIDLKKLYFKIF